MSRDDIKEDANIVSSLNDEMAFSALYSVSVVPACLVSKNGLVISANTASTISSDRDQYLGDMPWWRDAKSGKVSLIKALNDEHWRCLELAIEDHSWNLQVSPLGKNGLSIVTWDATPTKNSNNIRINTITSEDLHKQVIDSLPCTAVLIFDKQKVCVFAEGGNVKKKKSQVDFINKTFAEVIGQLRIEEIIVLFDKALSGESGSIYALSPKSGKPYLIHLSPFNFESIETSGVLVLFNDLSAIEGLDVSLKEQNYALKQSEGRLRSVLASLPGGAVMGFDTDLRYILAEGLGLKEAGFIPELMIGKTLHDLLPPGRVDRILPKYQAALRGETSLFEVPTLEGRTYQTHIAPQYGMNNVPIGGLVVAFDITRLKDAEKLSTEALAKSQESERIYKLMAKAIQNGGVVVLDKSLICMIVEGSKPMIGEIIEESPIGKFYGDLLPSDMMHWMNPFLHRALKGESQTLTFRTPSGTWFQANILPLTNKVGEVEGVLNLTLDVSDLKNAELNLQSKVAELSKLNMVLTNEVNIREFIEVNVKHHLRELKERNEELSQFAYVASHDLQEPLRMVASYTQLLAKKYNTLLDEEGREFINYAVEGAERMRGLINDLLNYSRVSNNPKEMTLTDLNEILDIAKRNLALSLDERDVHINSETLPILEADPGSMVQLFQNLISNAIKFTPQNRVPVISFKVRDTIEEWIISVKDNGIGMNMDHKERIFQIFQRLHGKSDYPGTGIGLAICKKIIDRLRGKIWVESELGEGSTFYFSIPKLRIPAPLKDAV